MLFVRRTYVLSYEEAVRWTREQAAPLVTMSAVDHVEMTRLKSPALRGDADWQWLIEMHCLPSWSPACA
jgi:hypothetical protein